MSSATRTERLDTESVVAAAARIADRKGLEHLSLSALARALGVRTPSLYTHVAGLPGLRRLLGLRGLDELNAAIARAALGRSGDEAVIAAARAYRDYCHEHPGTYAASVPTIRGGDAAWAKARDRIRETLALALRGLDLDAEEKIHAIRGFRSIVHGFASMEAAGAFTGPVDRDESFARIVATYLAGLRSR
ncbi:MAG TPA: WHG domain-containing protein, partial [Spirochaetia bacterium]